MLVAAFILKGYPCIDPYVEHSLEPTRTELEQNRNGTENVQRNSGMICVYLRKIQKRKKELLQFFYGGRGGALHHISGVNISIGKNIECFSQQNF